MEKTRGLGVYGGGGGGGESGINWVFPCGADMVEFRREVLVYLFCKKVEQKAAIW